jgi:hypothetical protein
MGPGHLGKVASYCELFDLARKVDAGSVREKYGTVRLGKARYLIRDPPCSSFFSVVVSPDGRYRWPLKTPASCIVADFSVDMLVFIYVKRGPLLVIDTTS